MTLTEFSVQFDILYNNISSNQAPGLTEYEKSVFLTQAQEAVILDLYKGTAGDSFETTEEVTRYLSSLVATAVPPLTEDYNFMGVKCYKVILPKNLLFVTYQSAKIADNDVLIIPTRQDSLFKDLNNPFRGANKHKILCISEEEGITLYSKYDVTDYYVKYLSKPYPIILNGASSETGLTINGEYVSKEVDWLPEGLHTQILLRAVQIAKAVWQS